MDIIEYISLTDDEQDELLKLSALNYKVHEMALYFDRPLSYFEHDAVTEGTRVNTIIKRGKLIARANPDIKLFASAESGNITAIQQLSKRLKEYKFEDMLDQLYDD